MTLNAVLRENVRSAPHRTALCCGADTFTYSQLQARVDRLAETFARAGVGSGSRIVWLGQNCHRWMEALLAAGHCGAVLCPLNWRLSAKELSDAIADLQPSVVLWQKAELESTAQALRTSASSAAWICHDDAQDEAGYEALLRHAGPSARASLEKDAAPVLMLLVNDPKGGMNGAMLSHSNLLIPGLVMAQLQNIDFDSVNLLSAPLFHIAALFSLIPAFQKRGANVVIARAEPRKICEAIHRHRCTHGLLFAPTINEIVELNVGGRYDLKSFRSGLPDPRWQAMVTQDVSPWGLRTGGYGQTETNMAVLAALCDTATSTSGRVAPYAEVRIVDGNDEDVPAAATGQIIVRGASVHQGYWNRERINAERFRNGWWHTADLGVRSADGVVSFIGPMGRMIKSGAENIFGSEIERCLAEHPAVREVAVIGVPDAVWIQSIKAIVVLREDQTVSEQQLVEHCKARLATYKKPRSIVLRQDSLPRSSGALDYAALDSMYGGGNYPGEGTRSV